MSRRPSLKTVRRTLLSAVAVIGSLLFLYTIIAQWDTVLDAIGHISLLSFLALTGTQLLAFIIRTYCWEMCVRAAGASTPPAALHLASAASFFTSVLGPAHLAPAARVAALKRTGETTLPTRGQMVAADGVLLFIYGVLCAVFIVAAADVTLLERLGLIAACVAAATSGFYWHHRLRERAWVKPLLALRARPKLLLLLLLSTSTLFIQVWRWLSVLRGVGFHHLSFVNALLTYLSTTLTASPVPLGPGLYPVRLAPTVSAITHVIPKALHAIVRTHPRLVPKIPLVTHLAHSQPLAHAVAAIIILTLSALAAAVIYTVFTFAVYDRPAGWKLLRATPHALRRTPQTASALIRRFRLSFHRRSH